MSKWHNAILLFILFLTIKASHIIPDPNSPISISYPSTGKIGDTGTVIKISFTLPLPETYSSGLVHEKSFGIYYGQYIGIVFLLQEAHVAMFTDATQFKCEGKVHVGDQVNDITLSSQVASSGQHIAYCKMEEFRKPILPGEKVELYISFLRNIPGFVLDGVKATSIFTASSLNDDKYISDLSPVYSTFSIHPISPSLTAMRFDLPATTTIQIDTEVTFKINLSMGSWINLSDYSFALIYDPKYFINVGVNTINAVIDGTTKELDVLNFEANGNYHSISGSFSDYFTITSAFDLEFIGFKTNFIPSKNCFAQLAVYYKNTNNVVMQNSKMFEIVMPTFKKLTINTGYDQEYFRSGAFPIKFIFEPSVPITDFYLVIKHKYEAADRRITFIPSTCDLTSITANIVNDRPLCYPLSYDYPDTNSVSGNENGSGFFFYIKGPLDTEKSIIVWAYFDKCGPDLPNLLSYEHEFEMYAYKTIDVTKYDVNRFSSASLIANYDFTNKVSCYSTDSGNLDTAGYHWVYDGTAIWGEDRLQYREYYNWELFNYLGANIEDLGNALGPRIHILDDNPIEKSICLRVTEKFHDNFRNSFPVSTDIFQTPGGGAKETQIDIKYTKELVTNYKTSCDASWSFTTGEQWIQKGPNYMSSLTSNVNQRNTADITDNSINSQISNNYNVAFGTPAEADQHTPPATPPFQGDIYFALFDDCHQFAKNLKITSLYQPFEIRIGIYDSSSGVKVYSKVMRMIKLFAEGGIFNALTSNTNRGDLFTNHFGYQEKDKNMYGVCIIELSNQISTLHSANLKFNSIGIWLFLGSLIETDYQTTSEYPVSNLAASVKAYAFPSQYTLGNQNFFGIGHATLDSPISYLMKQIEYTSYHFFMGSLLSFFHNMDLFKLADATKSLFLPYYCPTFHANLATEISGNKQFPAVVGAFLTHATTNQSWERSNSLMKKKTPIPPPAIDNNIYTSIPKTAVSPIAEAAFTPVSLNGPITALNDIIMTLNRCQPGTCTSTCTAHVIMLDEDLYTDQLIAPPSVGDQIILPKLKYLYPYGKPFSGFIMIINNHNYPPSFKVETLMTISLDKLVKNNILSSINKVGYWCAGSRAADTSFVSNYLNDRLLADYVNKDIGTAPTLGVIKQYTKNHANSFSFEFELPNLEASISSFFSFTLTKLATICGIQSENSEFLTDCIRVDNYNHQCQIIEPTKKIIGSCYNVDCDDNNPTNIMMSGIRINSPNKSYNVDDSPFNFITLTSTGTGTLTFTNTDITGITLEQYFDDSFAYNKGALGKMYFKLDLKRDVPRNVKIVITSPNFNKLLVTNLKPKCALSFKDQYPFVSPDIDPATGKPMVDPNYLIERSLFDYCIIDWTPIANKITIATKNIAFKNNFTLKNILYIHIWPAVLFDLKGTQYTIEANVDSLPVNIQGRSGQFAGINPTPRTEYEAISTVNKLCHLTGLSVLIPGEKSDYTFTLFLSHPFILEKLPNVIINDVTIYFPLDYYQGIEDIILCSEGTTKLVCSYLSEGVLNIQWPKSINDFKDHEVTISSIRNPVISTSTSLTFAYSLNKYNLGDNKTKYVLVYGIGDMRENTDFSEIANAGVLRFYKLPSTLQSLSSTDARTPVTHIFRIFPDSTSQSSLPDSITEPLIIIEFPSDYQIYAPAIIPTVTFDEYELKNNQPEKKNAKEMKLIVSIMANRLFVRFNKSLAIKGAIFWQITISGLILPQNVNMNNDAHSGAYHLMAINHDSTIFYSSPMNANNYSTDLKEPADSFRYEQWFKGDKLTYGSGPNPKWYIDIVSSTDRVNKLSIQPGRYYKAGFKVISNDVSLSATTDVTLVDPIFKTMEDKYTVISSINDNQDFYIGCPCNTLLGSYFVSFEVSNTEDFAIINQIQVNVYVDKKGVSKITYTFPAKIPSASTFWVKYFLEEPNFETLIINWKNQGDNNKENTISIPPKTFTRKDPVYSSSNINSYFMIDNSATSPLKYTVTNPNSCYEFENKDFEVEIDTAATTGTIPTTFPLNTEMSLEVSTTTNSLPKNSVAFTYTPTVLPSYLYCLLQCLELPIPTIEEITFRTLEEFLGKYKEESPNMKYYNVYIAYANPAIPIKFIFNDLIRGLNYRLICVLEEADNKTNRNHVIGSTQFTTSGNTNTQIVPVPIGPSYCSTIRFTKDIDDIVKKRLINLCQIELCKKGFYSDGCVICSEIGQMILNQGMHISKNICEIPSRLRLLTPEVTPQIRNTQQVTSDKRMLTICVQQDVRCPTDPETNLGQLFKDFIDSIDSVKYDIDKTFTPVESPDITITPSDFFGELLSWNKEGSVSFNTFYQGPNVLACYYMIVKAFELVPSIEEMESCALSGGFCGGAYVSSRFTKDIERKVSDLILFHGIKYTMYLGCRNGNPRSQHTITIPLGSFTTEYEDKFCPDGTTINYPDCLISSFFIPFKYMSLFILMLFGLL